MAVEHVVEALQALPLTTEAVRETPLGDGDYSDWYALSERGLFAYDWHNYEGPFLRFSRPREPIRVQALSDEARRVAQLVTCSGEFRSSSTLTLPS